MSAVTSIIFISDWDTEPDAPEWGDWEAMAEYMTRWDMGDETDAAQTSTESLRGSDDKAEEFDFDGLTYTLTWNTVLRYAALERSPLN